MCQKCNDALMSAASAASLLAKAAKDLYSINNHTEADVLAKAAAELFKPEEEVKAKAPGTKGSPDTSEGSVLSGEEQARAELNATLPEGMVIGDDNLVRINGVVIGQAMIVRRPTRH